MFKQSIGIDKNFENKQSREQSLLSPGEGGGGEGGGAAGVFERSDGFYGNIALWDFQVHFIVT